jgi:hypothetical protein
MRRSRILGFILVLTVASSGQDRRATVIGSVQDILGKGIAQARATLMSEPSQRTVANAEADESGLYRFTSIPSGEYTIKLAAPGFAQLAVRSVSVGASEDEVLPPVELSVASLASCGGDAALDALRVSPASMRGGALRGKVLLDPWPKHNPTPPISDAVVTLICAGERTCGETRTNATGDFVFEGIAAGMFTLRVSQRGFYPTDVSGFIVRNGYDALYWPILVERCRSANCDPRRRPKRPPVRCE